VRVPQLCLVQGAVDGDVTIAEFREGRGGAADDGAEERLKQDDLSGLGLFLNRFAGNR